MTSNKLSTQSSHANYALLYSMKNTDSETQLFAEYTNDSYLMVYIQHGCKVQKLIVLVNFMQMKEDYCVESFSRRQSGCIHGRHHTLHH
jgi:hypothetical protein